MLNGSTTLRHTRNGALPAICERIKLDQRPDLNGYRQASDSVASSTRRKRTLDLLVRTEARERLDRKATMRQARLDRVERIAAERLASALDLLSPLESFKLDDSLGRLPRSTDTVSETRKLDTGDRHYSTFKLDAPGYLVRLERLAMDYVSERRAVASAMATPAFDGRPALPRAASSVNAAKVSSASKRQRVADSFDARTAEARRTARPYSKRQLALDIASGSTRGGECLSVKLDPALMDRPGFARLCATERLMRGEGVTFTPARVERDRRDSKASRKASKASRGERDTALLDRLGVRPAAEASS